MAATTALLVELEHAVDGLVVLSETDAPLQVFLWPQPLVFAPQTLLVAAGLPPETPVETVSLERFFAPRVTAWSDGDATERATVARFQALQQLLSAQLTDIRIYRLGDIAIQVWIVGTTAEGRVAGLTTLVVET